MKVEKRSMKYVRSEELMTPLPNTNEFAASDLFIRLYPASSMLLMSWKSAFEYYQTQGLSIRYTYQRACLDFSVTVCVWFCLYQYLRDTRGHTNALVFLALTFVSLIIPVVMLTKF